MPYDVFISHSGKDHTAVYEIASFLKGKEITCFIDDDNIPPGSQFSRVIAAAIRESKVFLLILSLNSDSSPDVLREVELATTIEKLPIIPFRLENIRPMEIGIPLAGISWIDGFPPPLQKYMPKLLNSVRRYLDNNEPPTLPPDPPRPPPIKPGVWYPISLDKVDDWVRAHINICDAGEILIARSWIYRKNRYTGDYERALKRRS